MLALFKQSKVCLGKTFQRSCASTFSKAGPQFRLNQSQFECATPNLRAFSTAEDALSCEQQIEEGIRKLENEPFDFDWKKLNGLNTKALAEQKEAMQKKVEQSLLSSDESTAKFEQSLKERLGPNYYRFKNRIHRETYAGFNDGFAPRPHKFNLFDRANNASIPPSTDYVVPFNPFEEFLSRLTYIDYNNGRVRQEWKLEHQNAIHYNQLYPDMKNENYLADKPQEYLLIHNVPKNASRLSLYQLVSSFGPVTDFRVRSNLLGELAFVEVMYSSAMDATRAKRELYRLKFSKSTLYPMNYEDATKESPERRTLVVYNIDPTWDQKKILYELSNFGNVMDIQVPTKFANGKLPTRKEILNHISLLNLEGPQKDRVRIRERVYDINQYGHVTYEEKTHRLPEVADYVHNLEEVFDEEKAQTMSPKEFRDRFEKEQKNKNRKFYLEEIAGAFPNYFYCADYTKIQHLLDSNVAESSEYTPDQKLYRVSLTEKQALAFKQSLFAFQEQNRGYCFVTYASEDDAKKAIIQCGKTHYAKGPLSADLKLNTNHVDWDSETFHDYMKSHDYQIESVKEKIVSEHHDLNKKEEFLRQKEEYYEASFGDQLEQTFYEAQVPKSNLSEAQLTPEQIREKYSHLDKQRSSKSNLRDNDIYQAVKDELFVESESAKVKVQGLGSDRHQVGRVKRSEVTERDYIELMEQLRSGANKNKAEISEASKEYFDELDKLRNPRILRELLQANEELAAFETSEDLKRADKLREKVRKMSKEWQDKEISNQVHEFEDKYFRKGLQKEQQLQKSKQRALADAEKRKNRKRVFETNIKEFSTRRELDSNSVMQMETERSLRELKFKAVKMHTGRLTEQDLDQLYKTRVENYENNLPQDPHFLVRDAEGAMFINEADVRRFEEDIIPEDPVERAAFEEAKREQDAINKQLMEEAREGVDPAKELIMPATLAMLKHGIPIESFHFKPNAQFSDIESYIDELNKLDEVYSYAKQKDEHGEEVIVKLIRPKYKYDIEKIIEYTPEAENEKVLQAFRSRGLEINEADLATDVDQIDIRQNIQELQQFLSRTDHSEDDLKLIDLLQNDYPEVMESVLTGEIFPDRDRFLKEIEEQAYVMKMEDKMRALTKDDILKYRSSLFSLKNEQGKMYKSKYSKV